MIEKLNKKIRPLLEIYDKLKDVLKIAKINTPRIATCGMQSHGKSSTLESITKIELPTKAETCTICPIKICLREERKEKEYYNIKIIYNKNPENDNDKEEKLKDFKKLKDKIDEFQEKVKAKFNLSEQKVTNEAVIQIDVYKKDVPNLDLYDLPGVTFVEGIKEEAEKIYEAFLDDNDTTVLLILNGSDDLTNSSVTNWMKNVRNYKNRFIPIIAKADLIKNFEGKYRQLKGMKLNNKPCLVINKNKEIKELKNLSDKAEVEKIREIIPDIDNYPVNIGRRKLIDELIKIQYEKYKENFKDIINRINIQIKINKEKLDKLPPEYDKKEDFCDSFIDIFEELLKIFNEKIKKFKKGPEGTLLKYNIQTEYKEFIKKSKEKVNDFFTLEFCEYVTNNIKQTNSDKISILKDETPFQRLINPKINEILNIFEEIIDNIYKIIKEEIQKFIDNSFDQYVNLKDKVNELYDIFSKSQYDKMKKFYKEICLLETRNITTFDLELNYKCHVLVRKILNFLYKGNELPKDNNDSNNNNNDTSDNIISDNRDDIIKGVKNINDLLIIKIKELTKETIDKLTEEAKNNPNYKEEVKKKYEEYKSDILQMVGIINNYEIEQLTRIYDSLGCKGRPKLSYNPENIETFDERIEDIDLNGKDGYEFIPGFQFIKNKNLNDFINLFKNGKVLKTTANTIVKMVAYAEVMCNRIIDFFFLSIQNYLYDNLTNQNMINHLRNEVHKLLYRLDYDECKKLLEVNREIAEEIKNCKKNIKQLTSSLEDIKKAHSQFYEDNNEENEDRIIEKRKENNEENDNDEDRNDNSDN